MRRCPDRRSGRHVVWQKLSCRVRCLRIRDIAPRAGLILMLVAGLQRGTILRRIPARFVLSILRAILERTQKRHCVACQRPRLPSLLSRCTGVISVISERVWSALLSMRNTMRRMSDTLLGMWDALRRMGGALLSVRTAMPGCVWETRGRDNPPGENRLLNLWR